MLAEMTEDNCSICLDSVSNNCDRTVVRLRCSHVFHLDCVGSAFNASGVMQCPNCRHYENGTWRRFLHNNLEENNDEETVDEEEDDDDDDDDDDEDDDEEVLQFNPRSRYEYRLSLVHDRIRTIRTRRRQGVDGHRFELLTPREASPSHIIHHRYSLPLGGELSAEFPGICANITRANHPTIASADSAQDESNMEPVGHLFAFSQGGTNDPVFQRTQPFSSSSPAPVTASMTAGSSSNGDVLVDSSIGFSRGGLDYCDNLSRPPSSSSLSPATAAVLASMATRSIRKFTAGFRGNRANGIRLAPARFPSSSEQTKDVFHAASSSENPFHGRHTASTSEPTRNLTNVASMNVTSQNEPQAAIHPPQALEEIEDSATSEYLLDEMDPSSASHE